MRERMIYVRRKELIKKSEFQMGFEPTTFRTIGPRNIYTRDIRHKVVILFYSILFLLLLEMLV